jgi:hypothetical protein
MRRAALFCRRRQVRQHLIACGAYADFRTFKLATIHGAGATVLRA